MTVGERIPVSLMQEAFQRSRLTLGQLAHYLEWYDSRGKADTSRVQRALGLAAHTSHGGKYCQRATSMDYHAAVRMVVAMGYDPVDWDL